jgi:hypothetical protein
VERDGIRVEVLASDDMRVGQVKLAAAPERVEEEKTPEPKA